MKPSIDRPLIIMHVPRTGGTALTGYIRQRVTSHSVCPGLDQDEILENAAKADYAIFTGHVGIDFIERFNSCYKVFFMRDPLARVFSMWNQIRLTSGLSIVKGDNCAADFQEWCYKSYKEDPSIFNQVTLWLGVGRVVSVVDNNTLLLAIKNANRFDFVGLTESFQVFFYDFIKAFSFPLHSVNYENSSSSKLPTFNSEFIEWFINVSRFDYELYRVAQDLAWRSHSRVNNT